MNFSFFDALQDFGCHRPSSPAHRGLPADSEADRIDPETAVVAALGSPHIELEWHETPQLWRRLIEQADVCLEHARLAEKGLRFSAACGLILTAQQLLRRSLSVECSTTAHLTLERAVIERMDASRQDLDRLLDLAVQVRLFAA